jgi:hypothetical protein
MTKSKGSISLDKIFLLLQEKTPCCDLKNGQIKCSVIFQKKQPYYDLFISQNNKNFSLIFIDPENIQSPAVIQKEAELFFTERKICNLRFYQKNKFVQTIIPIQQVESIINQLQIFCPEDDLLTNEFFNMDQKEIDKKCLEIDDLDEFDEEYNIV